jgi:hypothetical protein
MTYVLVGLIGAQKSSYDGQLGLLVSLSVVEAESLKLDDTTIPEGVMSFVELRAALMAGQTIMEYNRDFDPPLNLVVGEVADGQLAALVLPPASKKSDVLVRTAALRYGIAVRRLT